MTLSYAAPSIGLRVSSWVSSRMRDWSDYCASSASSTSDQSAKFCFRPLIGNIADFKGLLRFDRDPRWSETGDRYIIKLFRDYVFHSVDESGNPVVNLGHVLTNLNKVDFLPRCFVMMADYRCNTARCRVRRAAYARVSG